VQIIPTMSSSEDRVSALLNDHTLVTNCDEFAWNASSVAVAPGASFSIPVVVVSPLRSALLHYQVDVADKDIELSIEVSDGQDTVVLFGPERIVHVDDVLRVQSSSSEVVHLIIKFSNTYSWVNSKVLSYQFQVFVPREGPGIGSEMSAAAEAEKA
jgi:hypothetical protein